MQRLPFKDIIIMPLHIKCIPPLLLYMKTYPTRIRLRTALSL